MILYPPKHFDSNEVFILIALLVILVLTLKLPRQLSVSAVMLIWVFNVFLALAADITIGIPPYDLYDVIDSSKYEFFDMVLYGLCYPGVAYLIMNHYESHKPKGLKIGLWMTFYALFTTLFEWIAALFHVYTYKGWNIYLSFAVYLFLYGFNILLLRFIHKTIRK
jgi:hypothetical protein